MRLRNIVVGAVLSPALVPLLGLGLAMLAVAPIAGFFGPVTFLLLKGALLVLGTALEIATRAGLVSVR